MLAAARTPCQAKLGRHPPPSESAASRGAPDQNRLIDRLIDAPALEPGTGHQFEQPPDRHSVITRHRSQHGGGAMGTVLVDDEGDLIVSRALPGPLLA